MNIESPLNSIEDSIVSKVSEPERFSEMEKIEKQIGDLLQELRLKSSTRIAASSTPDHTQTGISTEAVIQQQQLPDLIQQRRASTLSTSFVQSELGRNGFHTWEAYKMLSTERIEESLDDPIGELRLLQETDGIENYHRKFDLIRSKVDLPEAYLVKEFLAGLSADTQLNVKMFQPQTIRQCLSIGRLYEVAHPLKRIVPSVTTEQITKTEKEDAFTQVDALLDAKQDEFSREQLKISEENAKIERFHLLETEKLKKKESALRVQLTHDLDDIGFHEDSFEANMEHECSALHGKATLTTHSTVAAANFQFNSSSMFNGSNDEMEMDHASHVWHRWKNKESHEQSLMQNKGTAVDELETTFVNVQPAGTARLNKTNGRKDEELKVNRTDVVSPQVVKGEYAPSSTKPKEEKSDTDGEKEKKSGQKMKRKVGQSSFQTDDEMEEAMIGKEQTLHLGNSQFGHISVKAAARMLVYTTMRSAGTSLQKVLRVNSEGFEVYMVLAPEIMKEAYYFMLHSLLTAETITPISPTIEQVNHFTVWIRMATTNTRNSPRTNRVWDPGGMFFTAEATRDYFHEGLTQYSLLNLAVKLLGSSLCLDKANGRGDQPLAQINIYETSLALDNSASIHASPHVLGLKGEDTEWVNVAIANPKPSSDDWVGVFSPAKFDASACWQTNGKEKAPFICSSPIKYMFAKTAPDYTKTGKVILKFQIINQRADISFALFTGNLWGPKLLVVSNTVAFVNPKAPVYPRLALGKNWDEMTVTWTSGYNIDEAAPFIEWSAKGLPARRSPAGTLTFSRNSMCGAPARTVGWRDPGFIHTAFLKELWPNREYIYRLGHDLVNGSTIWSKNYTFVSSPYPGQDSLQRVIIFGDMGKGERDGSNEYNDYQPGSLKTTDQVIKDLKNIDIVFHIGDITYANGYISQWDQFTAQVEPIASTVPYMIASGNHERDWPDSGSFYGGQDSGGECGVLAETMFYFPAENRAKFWYKADYGMFRFCVADTEHDWREGTEQYQFIERCLASVDRKAQPWLIFIAHRVLGYSTNDWYGQEGTFEEPMGRESLQKLWQKYKVDIAFYGHVHNYERSCPIYQSQCVSNEKDHYSGTFKGTIHVVVGGAGAHLSPFSSLTPKWSLVRDYDFGFVKLTASNHSSLLFEYKKSNDGSLHDSFTISRDYRDVLACTHDSCEPTTSAS